MRLIVSRHSIRSGRFIGLTMQTVQQRFGKRVRDLRQKRGWTQEQLGEKAGKHWTYIGGIERGTRNPTIVVAESIAIALDVPLADLFQDGIKP